jgi:hypothetical protein
LAKFLARPCYHTSKGRKMNERSRAREPVIANKPIRERAEFRRHRRRLSPGAIALWMAPLIALMFLASSASAATVPSSNLAVSSPTLAQSGGVTVNRTNGTSASSTVTPDTNIVTNVYNDMGYLGNATIYPTKDIVNISNGEDSNGINTFVPLPLLSHNSYQTGQNVTSGWATPNMDLIQDSTNASEVPRYWNLGPDGDWGIMVWVWVVASGQSVQTDLFPDGCSDTANQESTGAIDVSVSASGVSGGSETDIEPQDNSGINVTAGSITGDNGNAGDFLTGLVFLGVESLAATAETVDPGLGLVFTSGDAGFDFANYLASTPGPQQSFMGTSSVPGVSGNNTANELELTKGGNITNTCGGGGTVRGGQDVYQQADFVQSEIFAPGEPGGGYVSPGELEISSYNDLYFKDNYDSQGSSTVVGASPSFGYAIEPAVSVGGYVHLWTGGPPVPKANVVIQQQYTQTTFQSNYENPSASDGYYHVFLEPLTGAGGTYTQMNAYLDDPMGDTDTNVGELPLSDWTSQWHDVEDVDANLSGGQLNGTVTGLLDTGGSEHLAGATVELCNVQGCISTTTNSAGAYTLQFPVAGTSSDEDSLTVSDGSGWTTDEITGLELPVGKYSQENVGLSESAGGGCVAQGTPILTPTGYVQVQDLQSGQSIEEYDFSTGSLVPSEFLSANVTSVSTLVDINHGLLYLTPTDQPIYIENGTFVGWLRDPQNLTTSDRLFDPTSGSWIRVTSISMVSRQTDVYDVVTGGFNNFIANGVLLDKKG